MGEEVRSQKRVKDKEMIQKEEERPRAFGSYKPGFDLSIANYLCIPLGKYFNFQVFGSG